MGQERRKDTRYETPFIPVQVADVDAELIDLSLSGAAVIHRSPIREGEVCTLVFPSYGGIYVPCKVLRSIVQVRRDSGAPEYVFRSAIIFLPMGPDEEGPLLEFLSLQIERLHEKQRAAAASANAVRDEELESV